MDLKPLESKTAAGPEHLQICEDVMTTPVDKDGGMFQIKVVKNEPDVESEICEDVMTTPVDKDRGMFQIKAVKNEPEDQDPFFCELCKTFFITECNVHGPPVFVPDAPVSMGVTDRAAKTLPPGLEIRESSINDAGFGVFNKGDIIPVGVDFGPYKKETMDSKYSVVICKRKQKHKDVKVDEHGNWMRYVNCARNDDEQNLVAFQHQGGILYRCCRPINPGQELLLSYKKEFIEDLDVKLNCLSNKESTDNGNEQELNDSQQIISRSSPANTKSGQMQNKVHHCSECGKSFTQKRYLTLHQRSHKEKKTYECTQCGKIFSRQSSFQKHQRIHTGEKPYECTQCGKNFIQQSSLQRHQRIHTGEKPYKCTHCGKNFICHSTLKVHQRIHTGEKPYKCTLCGKNFTSQSTYQRHQRIHTGEKPYKCTHCGKNFTQQGYLNVHQRIHTGEKPYQCMNCGMKFTHLSSFRLHQRIHTGEKPYVCTQCGKTFTQNSSLHVHQRLHMRKKDSFGIKPK